MTAALPEIIFSDGVKADQKAAILALISSFRERNLPVILSPTHLSLLTGVETTTLYATSNSPSKFYREFSVRKKGGGRRRISAPLPLLLELQQWILSNVLEKIPVHAAAKAYKKGSSIKENARFHRRQQAILKSDVEDFFGSISEFWVYTQFCSLGYSSAVSRLLSGICCKNGSLPQGAATSGYLSNIFMRDFDNALFDFCRPRGLRYTRYADDIAISGNDFDSEEVKRFISEALRQSKLRINLRKTRMLRRNTRQQVTGVVVNERLGPSREFLRRIRQDVYYIEKFGVYGHARHAGWKSPLSCLNNLLGRITHAQFLLGKNTSLERAKKLIERSYSQVI
jgi:RNA-directed DNA polymerase